MMRGRTLALLLVASLSAACAATGAVPKPFPVPGGASPAGGGTPDRALTPTTPTVRRLDMSALMATALSLRGAPYRNGGSDVSGFDCSGFTQYVFARYGVQLPRATYEQYRLGRPVPRDA